MRNRTTRNIVMAVVICLLVGVASSAAFAQKATVLRVVVVKTDSPAAYAQELEKGKQIMKSLGIPANIRVFQARFAGPEAGTGSGQHRVSQHGRARRRRCQD